MDSCRFLKDTEGFEVTFIKPEENGKINLEELESLIRKDTSIVSIMAVNNEIGVSQVNFLRIVRDNLLRQNLH